MTDLDLLLAAVTASVDGVALDTPPDWQALHDVLVLRFELDTGMDCPWCR